MSTKASPFVKWVGGKRALYPEIARRLPKTIGSYWEPFLGGGAVFFALKYKIQKAYLSDLNSELITSYQVLQAHPEAVIAQLAEHSVNHEFDDDYYYQIRAQVWPDNPVQATARFIYLNKTCFNGVYRVNKSGLFNVPKGKHLSTLIYRVRDLYQVHKALRKAKITQGDFQCITPEAGDFVYCDPPFDSTYNSYTANKFTDDDQLRLRDAALDWVSMGASVMLSNLSTSFIQDIYSRKPFIQHEVTTDHLISGQSKGRKLVTELLITTY